MTDPRYWAIVPAAGSGQRMQAKVPKQYLELAGQSVLEHTLALFLDDHRLNGLVVCLHRDDRWWPTLALSRDHRIICTQGGKQRWQSVQHGVQILRQQAQPDDWVLVHDAARPCLHKSDLDNLLITLADDPVGGLLATPVRDTLKRADQQRCVLQTVERQDLWQAQTPQMFRYSVLARALEQLDSHAAVTDEADAVERLGFTPKLVQGRSDNLKITHPADLELADYLLNHNH